MCDFPRSSDALVIVNSPDTFAPGVAWAPGAEHTLSAIALLKRAAEKAGTPVTAVGDAEVEGFTAGLSTFAQDGISRLIVVGMPTEGAVKDVVLAGCERGLEVVVVHEGIRAMNVQPDDGKDARRAMRDAGAYITRLLSAI